jgi:ABC-type glutathione transport system ATPase component
MSASDAELEAWEKLTMVGLADVGNNLVSTYSGWERCGSGVFLVFNFFCTGSGMKRRLSVAISTIGDPYFLLLDEPVSVFAYVHQLNWRCFSRIAILSQPVWTL